MVIWHWLLQYKLILIYPQLLMASSSDTQRPRRSSPWQRGLARTIDVAGQDSEECVDSEQPCPDTILLLVPFHKDCDISVLTLTSSCFKCNSETVAVTRKIHRSLSHQLSRGFLTQQDVAPSPIASLSISTLTLTPPNGEPTVNQKY
uniref:Uncharacterized protein n=1 Tax=Pipistrellus kuhlii TaxID=59472 RepID=A0A7J8B2S3_PIPKU|nr:hypothetical protein mPipKuh1_007845 [Pipistrellus kuhlii]